ncbi:MAG: 30S ribosome-binding factor RbfA [Gammaproteobacteria bacterium]|nr:30S ribosome-binding factor RbfA [Gammaproteobacteria bacterium]
MAREFERSRRVGEQMQRDLSDLIRREVKDPRLGMVTITGVEVSKDFASARVYVTLLGKEADEVGEDLEILNNAAGYLRGLLGKRIRLRMIPRLVFLYDQSIANGAHLSALIDAAIDSDKHSKD